MPITPRKLETHVNWRSNDVQNPRDWTLELNAADHLELDLALNHAKAKSSDLLEIGREDFPLEGLVAKLADVERELIDGRGFVRICALDTRRYDDNDLTLLYWGIGMHLGDAKAQNKQGHVLADVTDQGKRADDPTAHGYDLGGVGLDYHTDGADLVGLLCLRTGKSGGRSCVANIVAIYNELVETRPDLVAALFEDLPWDFRGEERPGGQPYYLRPVFTEFDQRLFCRFIPKYMKSSQRHPDAPRLSPLVIEAIDTVSLMAHQPQFNVYMDLLPGQMQFINNHHVLHGRTPYQDDVASGIRRHLKRLWLTTRYLKDRPVSLARDSHSHWHVKRSLGALQAAPPKSS